MSMAEEQMIQAEIASVEKLFALERFKNVTRPYTASQVASLRGTFDVVPASTKPASKLYWLCREKFKRGEHTLTFGCLDTVMVTQMAKYLETVYVSGWQCSSTASTTNEPGPDFADYPMNTVPQKVDQLFRAQQFHDRKQREARSRMTPAQRRATPPVDFMRPIIADGDTGFGGVTSVMKLTKLHIQAGAAGVHIEDQKPGAKKCGHMGGKVLVSIQEHVDRLAAARLQADILGTETVLIARTDADSATFLDTNIDARDHAFILGATVPGLSLAEALAASAPGATAQTTANWLATAKLMTYPQAVADAIKTAAGFNPVERAAKLEAWQAQCMALALPAMRRLAATLGFAHVHFCWEAPRSREGYYRVDGSTAYCIRRALEFGKYADIIWMETSKPDLKEARQFHEGVHAVNPDLMLAYNCSPSFNWDAYLTDEQVAVFNTELGKMGFVWQFTTLAGFHCTALSIDQLAKDMSERGSLAYVQTIQREERRLGVETLTHQKWSGTEIMDKFLNYATGGGASTSSMHGATEAAFNLPAKL